MQPSLAQMENAIVIRGFGPGESVLLHENAISNLRLRVSLEECWIGVSSGTKENDEDEKERLAACRAASAASTLAAKSDEGDERDASVSEEEQAAPEDDDPLRGHYTYVALWFNRPSFRVMSGSPRDPRGRIAVTRDPRGRQLHHISLAYLPAMTAFGRWNWRRK